MLGMVTEVRVLEEIATDLQLSDLDKVKGNIRKLYRKISNHINSDDFDELEDQGLPQLMAMRDKLRLALKLTSGDPRDNQGDGKGKETIKNGLGKVSPKEEEKEVNSKECDTESGWEKSEAQEDYKDALMDLRGLEKKHIQVESVRATATGGVTVGGFVKIRRRKLTGAFGNASESGELLFSWLACQISIVVLGLAFLLILIFKQLTSKVRTLSRRIELVKKQFCLSASLQAPQPNSLKPETLTFHQGCYSGGFKWGDGYQGEGPYLQSKVGIGKGGVTSLDKNLISDSNCSVPGY